MRAAIVTHYEIADLSLALKRHGFLLSKKPQFVFTYGGDGTILEAERKFPGIPLIPVQRSRMCSHCAVYNVYGFDKTLHALRRGRYKIKEEKKIEAVFRGRIISALNDIQVHMKDSRRALRFSVKSQKIFYKEVVGDGVVAATPYASGAYYRALGYRPFRHGCRLGFNNVWPKLPSLDVGKGVVVRLIREKAWLAADNFFLKEMRPGDSVRIKQSKKKARFVVIS
jgi:NAD kinase